MLDPRETHATGARTRAARHPRGAKPERLPASGARAALAVAACAVLACAVLTCAAALVLVTGDAALAAAAPATSVPATTVEVEPTTVRTPLAACVFTIVGGALVCGAVLLWWLLRRRGE